MNTNNNAQDLGRIAQEKSKMAADIFEKQLNTELFPIEMLKDNCTWEHYAKTAFMNSQPMSHRASLKDFAEVMKFVKGDIPMTLFHFGMLANSIEAVSPVQLGITASEYLYLIEMTLPMIAYYSNRAREIREDAQTKVDKEYKMKAVVDNGHKPILTTVTGQA